MSIYINEFKKLAAARGDALLSVYLPTHVKGAEIQQDPIRLKNRLRDLEARIEQIPHDKHKVRERIDALRPLIDDEQFWKHMSRGLALFVSDEGVVKRRLPHTAEELAVISDRFILRPLLPGVSSGDTFFLLDLSEKYTRLATCTRDGARQIDHDDLPEHIAEVVGYDVEEKSLQFHTEAQTVGTGGTRAAVFHGHGSGGEEDEQKERQQFLEAVDNAVNQIIDEPTTPLVLAGDERVVAMFKNLTHYPTVVEDSVIGNYDHEDIDEVYEMALPLVTPALDAAKRTDHDRLRQQAHTDDAVAGLDQILPTLENARVDTLFVDARVNRWGRFDREAGRVQVHDAREPEDEDLLDLAMVHARDTGAKVVHAEREHLPNEEPVAALLRF